MEFDKIKDIITEILHVESERIFMDSTFVDDLGADSLEVFQILAGVEDEFDIEISNEEEERIVTVGDIVALVKRIS